MTTSTDTAPAPEPAAITPTDLIDQVRAARAARERAERQVLGLAWEWAVSHEVEGPVRREQTGAPGVPGEGTGEFPDTARPEPDGPDALDRAFARYDAICRGQTPDPGTAPAPSGASWERCTQADRDEVAESEERRAWRGLPELRWDCAAPFAAALGRPTRSGRLLLRQALTLGVRLPRTHRRWTAGHLETRTATRVADAVAGQPDDVCAWVDVQVARRIDHHQTVGPVTADRLVTQALTELHAEELELERQEKLQARYARFVPGLGNTDARPGPDVHGLAEYAIRGDWPDLKAFDATIAALAEVIRRGDTPDACQPLDVRRSLAIGILADPLRAAAMLGHTPAADSDPVDEPVTQPTATRRQQVLVTFHLAADAVAGRLTAGLHPVGLDQHGRPWLDAVIREWAGRPDVHLTVRPVVHCGGCGGCGGCATYCQDRHQRHSYPPTDLDKELVALTNPHCVFPYCTTPATRSDCDHITPYDPDHPDTTPTCPRCNLAPLCRHHHRLKTTAGWTYRQIEPGVHTWTEPHGQTFLTTRWGTRDTTRQRTREGPTRSG